MDVVVMGTVVMGLQRNGESVVEADESNVDNSDIEGMYMDGKSIVEAGESVMDDSGVVGMQMDGKRIVEVMFTWMLLIW
jgi:nucleoside diphosphate kinase